VDPCGLTPGQNRRRNIGSAGTMVETPRIAATEMPITSSALLRVASYGDLIRKLGQGLVALALALSCAACGHSPTVLTAYQTEQQAQTHCPKDIVVWLNAQSGTYHLKGSGSYGRMGAGRYVCRGEADAAGMHEMSN
jgi:hypothetical protein